MASPNRGFGRCNAHDHAFHFISKTMVSGLGFEMIFPEDMGFGLLAS
jgi:hypothetical protein